MRILFLGLNVALASVGCSQTYPLWFIHQGELSCANTAVGYADASMYQDSAVADAVRQAVRAFIRQSSVKVRGSRAFWATEAGTFWMGSDVVEECDTTVLDGVSLDTLDTIFARGGVFVLLAPPGCKASRFKGETLTLSGKDPPGWIETLPHDEESYYAVGVAPKYFYEKSSWDDAERVARRNLAYTFGSHVRSMQKLSGSEGQDVRQDEVSVTLRDYRIVARWFDGKKGLFYVLVQMPVG